MAERPWDGEPTRDYGPRPPRPVDGSAGSQRPSRRPARWVTAAVLMAAGIGAIATATVLARRSVCTPRAGAAALPGDTVLEGDVDGDGCADVVLRHDGVLVIAAGVLGPGVRRFALDAGLDVMLGDWDCDGDDTPATYDPRSGMVTTYADWPSGSTPVATSSTPAQAGAAAAVTRLPGGCDVVTVP